MTDAVEVLRIDSLEDERLDAYVRLTERELRCVLEPQKGIFIAESAKVIERAVRAGYEPVSFLLGERWLDQMMPLFDQLVVREGAGPVPVFVASMELMEQLTGFNVTRGALAAFRRPRQIPVDEFLGGVVEAAGGRPVRVCVLEGIVDHTNVGAIFRSAAALNVDGILVSPTCCDPLYRRSARVSMGTVFQVPWTRIGSEARVWPHDGLSALHDAGFSCAAMALTDDSVSLDDLYCGRLIAWRFLWAPRVPAWAPRPLPAVTTRCAFRWRTGSIRSTWPRRAPSPFGSCART